MFNLSVNQIWLALMAATGVTYWLGETGNPDEIGVGPVFIMLALVLAKGLWVIYDFMELRHAPRLWRLLIVGWLGAVTSLIALAYWLGLS
jgi:hypothetical protein